MTQADWVAETGQSGPRRPKQVGKLSSPVGPAWRPVENLPLPVENGPLLRENGVDRLGLDASGSLDDGFAASANNFLDRNSDDTRSFFQGEVVAYGQCSFRVRAARAIAL